MPSKKSSEHPFQFWRRSLLDLRNEGMAKVGADENERTHPDCRQEMLDRERNAVRAPWPAHQSSDVFATLAGMEEAHEVWVNSDIERTMYIADGLIRF